jgi:hypothetical protein
VQRSDSTTATTQVDDCAEQLAKFFPATRPSHLSVQVTALRPGNSSLRETTILEFAAQDNAIFVSTLPLEFADHVRLETERKGQTTDATVVAVQYHEGRKAVAVRFLNGPCAWVTQQ